MNKAIITRFPCPNCKELKDGEITLSPISTDKKGNSLFKVTMSCCHNDFLLDDKEYNFKHFIKKNEDWEKLVGAC